MVVSLTWDALLGNLRWVVGGGKGTRGGRAKRWPRVPRSCGGEASMPPKSGTSVGRAHTSQVCLSTVRVTVLHCWDSPPEYLPWQGGQGRRAVSAAPGEGRDWGGPTLTSRPGP